MDSIGKSHLPRLPQESYEGLVFVHWTLTIEGRSTGWLTDNFHHHCQLVLLHTCSRYSLIAPVYVIMPDHMHVLLLGTDERGSEQQLAIAFLRKHLRRQLAPSDWQHQAHDNVLREAERDHGAFLVAAHYILNNPVRAGLVKRWQDYPYLGVSVPGYPELDIRDEAYWSLLWRIYNRLVGRSADSTRSRS